jgi:hypothetical protein
MSTIVSLGKYTGPIFLGIFHSTLRSQDYLYSELPMSVTMYENFKQLILSIKPHLAINPTNPKSIVFRDQRSSDWVVNNVMPQLAQIYNAYPIQVANAMLVFGIGPLLDPYAVKCSVCGLGIPKVRQGSCPICKSTAQTIVDPTVLNVKFLIDEREKKCEEIKKLNSDLARTGVVGILSVFANGSGPAQTTHLNMQQINGRISDIQSEIRKIDFEIQQSLIDQSQKMSYNGQPVPPPPPPTEAVMVTQNNVLTSVFCRYCGFKNENDAVYCKKCGKKIA